MEWFWIVAYLILACLALVQSLLLAVQTWEHRRYARSCMRGLDDQHATGRVAVFAPCKGLDVDLEANLRALLNQDYDNYEVTFIVESPDDPACPAIRRVMAERPQASARLVVAGRSTDCGQKVHNLRVAATGLSPQVAYLAFVDSDARPRPQWLRVLAGQLEASGVGAVTGYRWFVPQRATLANHLLYSVNCGIMSLLGRSSHYLVWGGSWGIRREVFDSIGLHQAWQGTLSDDLVASRQLRRAGIAVRFEPGCVVASPLDNDWPAAYSFLRRQYMVARFYTAGWWRFGLAMATLANLAWLGHLAALAGGLLWATPPIWIPAGVCAALYLLSVQRGLVRQDLVGVYFPDRQQALRKAGRFDIWAGPMVGLVHWLGMLGSLFGRHITWRGISYRVLPGGQVRLVRRDGRPVQREEPHVDYKKAG